MKGNFHVQFLGEGVAATSPPYPTPGEQSPGLPGPRTPRVRRAGRLHNVGLFRSVRHLSHPRGSSAVMPLNLASRFPRR